jgi:negative regulator of genetic competence, sporulation and motility
MSKIFKLSDVLVNSEKFEWSDALFMSRVEEWTLNSSCAVLDPDDIEDDADEEPKFAQDNNLKYILSIQDIQSIVDNAKQQKTCCTENDLFEAFLYYFDNDAFIEFGDKQF